jgi:hypothetical protein
MPTSTLRIFHHTILAFVTVALSAGTSFAQSEARVELGRLSAGASVAFARASSGQWGISIEDASGVRAAQPQPAKLELWDRDASDVRYAASGYETVERASDGVDATATVVDGSVAQFRVRDHWSVDGSVLSLRRTVEVLAGSGASGFASTIELALAPSVGWGDVTCFAPGALYGDPTYDGDRSPGGTLNAAARHYLMREDAMPAPVFGLLLRDGASVSMLDPTPRGDSTVAETKLAEPVVLDERLQFGAFGAGQDEGAPVRFGFRYPGASWNYGFEATPSPAPKWFRRFHPAKTGASQHYEVRFRFGAGETFPDLTRNTWRWAWSALNPHVAPIDVEVVRRVLLDHLQAQAVTVEGRTGIPFVGNTLSDRLQWNWSMIAMGFVGKNVVCADELLREGDRDRTARGAKMRETGLGIIGSLIEALPTVPLQGAGYDLATGKPWDHIWLAPWLRNASEDMRVLVKAYRRERQRGRDHPEWLAWVKQYVDWLIQQQRADGSFPRRWKPGSNEIAEPTGTTSYAPVPLLALMTEETGDAKYRDAAIRAADYVWSNWGQRGLFIGGASDNPNITDKEAGMLSLDAFLSLYHVTHDRRWLDRAATAATFAESWIWIWNLPMPLDADDALQHWKKGVPTIGANGITARGAGGVDEYLDSAVPLYAELSQLTSDPHYLDVARILLHGTKSMLALPGRTYDLKGPGWQQEHWGFGPSPRGRGVGGHRFWLPWISANHLAGITGLEEYDPALYRKLCAPEKQEPTANKRVPSNARSAMNAKAK